jgi:hypothetical protein
MHNFVEDEFGIQKFAMLFEIATLNRVCVGLARFLDPIQPRMHHARPCPIAAQILSF